MEGSELLTRHLHVGQGKEASTVDFDMIQRLKRWKMMARQCRGFIFFKKIQMSERKCQRFKAFPNIERYVWCFVWTRSRNLGRGWR